jgi:hypothetical protein
MPLPQLFKLPPLAQPTFDPRMMELPPSYAGMPNRGGYVRGVDAPPILPEPPDYGAMPDAPPPMKEPTAVEQYDQLQKPTTAPTWRRILMGAAGGGIPGAAMAALDREAPKREQYGIDREHLVGREKLRQSGAKSDAEVEYRQAGAAAQRQHGAYWDAKANEQTPDKEFYVNTPRGLMDTRTGAIVGGTEPAEKPLVLSEGQKAFGPDGKMIAESPKPPRLEAPGNVPYRGTRIGPDGKVIFQDNRTLSGGGSSGRDDVSQNTFRVIESRKQQELQSAEERARKRIDDGVDNKTAWADLEADKKRIQSAYESEVRAATGATGPTPNAGQQRPTISMRVLRERAIAAGKDPEEAIAKARGMNLTLVD